MTKENDKVSDNSIFTYELLNYWDFNDEFYVDYLVTNTKTGEQAKTHSLIPQNMLEVYDENSLEQGLLNIIERNNGKEFELPKTSDLNEITYKIFKEFDYKIDMLFIEGEFINDIGLNRITFKQLYEDIKKFHMESYFGLEENCLVVFGGLRCCFNDDLRIKGDEYER